MRYKKNPGFPGFWDINKTFKSTYKEHNPVKPYLSARDFKNSFRGLKSKKTENKYLYI